MRTRILVLVSASAVVLAGCVTGGTILESNSLPTDGTLDAIVVDELGDAEDLLDLVELRFVETASHVTVELSVAKLDPATVAQRLATLGYRGGIIAACWDPETDPRTPEQDGRQCAGVELAQSKEEAVKAFYVLGLPPEEGCNDWHWCAWAVPYDVVAGERTTLRLHVARELMPAGEAGDRIESPYAVSRAFKTDATDPERFLGRGAHARACTTSMCFSPTMRLGMSSGKGDDTDVGDDVVLRLARAGTLGAPAPTTVLRDHVGEVRTVQGERRDIDVVSVDIEETAEEVTYIVKVATIPDRPTHSFDMDLGVQGSVYEAWYTVLNGELRGVGAGHCGDPECEEWVDLVPKVEVRPGTPGTIRVSLAWKDFEDAPAGTLVSLASVDLGDPFVYQAVPLPVGSLTASSGGAWDIAWIAEPYVLKIGKGASTTG